MTPLPYRVGPTFAGEEYWSLRQRMALHACKWDVQVGDVSTLAPFALVLETSAWKELTALAEALARETKAASEELFERPELARRLAIPRRLRAVLERARSTKLTPSLGWMQRFDFHFTTDGWKISEVNADVPGGFTESTSLPRAIAELRDDVVALGAPGELWADAIAKSERADDEVIALVSAPGYVEDTQIMAYLASHLARRGAAVCLAKPDALRWEHGCPSIADASLGERRVGAIVRFYQAEWLSSLSARTGWTQLFAGGAAPVANSPLSPFAESKRFGLCFDALRSDVSTWRRLLPEVRDPRDAPWQRDDAWIIKAAYSNTGDEVGIRAVSTAERWKKLERHARWLPWQWIAQRRFEALPIDTALGALFVCLGVYTIDGRVAGVYGRASPRPLIDFSAIDVAVMMEAHR